MKVQAQQGDTVDLLCYRHYRRTQESSHRYLMPIRGCVWQPFYARAVGGNAGYHRTETERYRSIVGLGMDELHSRLTYFSPLPVRFSPDSLCLNGDF